MAVYTSNGSNLICNEVSMLEMIEGSEDNNCIVANLNARVDPMDMMLR